jgi:hypothetical protein
MNRKKYNAFKEKILKHYYKPLQSIQNTVATKQVIDGLPKYPLTP